MPSDGSVTLWLHDLKGGDQRAAEQLWQRYFGQLVGLARSKLQGTSRTAADEEDVVQCAFDSLFRGLAAGRFPNMADRDDLWRLLVVITARKAIDQRHYQTRLKRGGGSASPRPAPRAIWEVAAGEGASFSLDHVVGREPTAEFVVLMAEACEQLLDRLDDPILRRVAVWRMEGYSIEEIADKLQCVPRTVGRKLNLIRRKWTAEVER